MTSTNDDPYRLPDSFVDSLTTPAGGDDAFVWRDGKDIVAVRDKPLPSRCVKCNAPVAGSIKTRKFYWHTPWLYLLIFVGLLFYVIAALIVRKRSEHAVALCPTHARRRQAFIVGGFAMFAIGLFVAFSGTEWMAFGILAMVVAIVVGLIGGRIMVATNIDDRYARFRGASKAFLASLPPLPAHRRR